MKITILSLVAVSLTCFPLLAADLPAKVLPQFKARVVCFNGKLDSGRSCAGTNFQPDGALHAKGKVTCGFPGAGLPATRFAFGTERANFCTLAIHTSLFGDSTGDLLLGTAS